MSDISKLTEKYEREVLSLLFPNYHSHNSGKEVSSSNNPPNIMRVEFSPFYLKNPDSEYYFPPDSPFIHFTSKWGLFSMLNEGYFRQYPLNSAADLREVKWLGELLKLNEGILENFKQSAFFGSFSKKEVLGSEDELLFWRLYGQNTHGVALSFKLVNSEEKSLFLGKTRYKLPEAIDEFHEAHNKFLLETSLESIETPLSLCFYACFHKSPSYKHEMEVRLLSYSPNFQPKEDKVNFGVDYKGGEMIFYKKLPIYESKNGPYLKIEEIYLGPNSTESERQKLESDMKNIWFRTFGTKPDYGRPVVKISSLEDRVKR